MNIELSAIVAEAVERSGRKIVAEDIYAGHCGRLSRLVTQENLHLFRQYRNTVSGDPDRLIDEALASAPAPPV
jgi:hypothetical protein